MSTLNKEEQEIMDHIVAAYNGILKLGLKDNLSELEHGIHIVQMFITQHMLHRTNPEDWRSWYQKDSNKES